jgi:hypothetical protein
MLTGIDDIQ